MLILRCPRCGSTQVLTSKTTRTCRKCGFNTEDKVVFEKVEKKK
ncbi:Zinc finger, TFIIB-type domain protein [Candidatus Omnitrophus magneticus]|uniref:Zinc finger, TFIIB-type domain protein n=1 Tax=Candidatus Omnitrophus magneticus TaxID=1609969 RepID=A0A0F0CKK6_9BACT|nr:Zinc finger, TFIIB-type domain protein [Candidatus Omnitrophus magneticus]